MSRAVDAPQACAGRPGGQGGRALHVLMISDVYFPRINGVSTSIQTFRRTLVEAGHRVSLIAPSYAADEERGDWLVRVAARTVPVDPEDRMMKGRDVLRMEGWLQRQSFDLIHIQTPFVAHRAGVRLAERLRMPCVETYHTFFEEYLYNYVRFLPKSWMRCAARRFSRTQCSDVDGLIVPSTAMLEVLRGYGVDTRAAVIPTGIDLQPFDGCGGQRFRARHGIASQRPTLLYVGRVAMEKNIAFLVEVLSRVRREIPEILLVIAGEGPATEALKGRVRALGLERSVRFVGYLSRDQALQDCYCAGDLFVFGSRTETQGLVLLEAMALGVPVVSTAVMGTRDIVGPEQGAVVARENVGDFAAKVVSLLRDPARRRRLGEQARRFAGTWSPGAMAQRLLRFYAEIAPHPVSRPLAIPERQIGRTRR